MSGCFFCISKGSVRTKDKALPLLPVVPKTMEGTGGEIVNPSDYELVAPIGRGCFDAATVHLAKHKASGKVRAIKKIYTDECSIDIEMIQEELRMHRVLRHPHLLPSLGAVVQGSEIWALFPLMSFGSCRDLLAAHFREGLPELAILYILGDIARGLDYMHRRGVVHRAVTSSHILISGEGHAVLSGFHHIQAIQGPGGLRKRALHHFPSGNHYATCLYSAAPELLQQNRGGYDSQSDIYSLGIVGCELASGNAPFGNLSPTHMLLCKIMGQGVDLEVEEGQVSSLFHDMVQQCLQQDQENRPSATDLLDHPVFKQITNGNIPTLPELLQPVQPLTNLDFTALAKEQDAELALNEVTKAVAEADLSEEEEEEGSNEWIF